MIANKSVKVEFEKKDRYGRILGKIFLDGKDINLRLVQLGFAWHYKYYKSDQTKLDRVLYSSAELEAKKNKIGLWSMPAIPPWEFRRNKKGQRK